MKGKKCIFVFYLPKKKRMDLSGKKRQWAALLSLAFVWGTSFILMKKGLESYSNIQVAGFRIFLSFLLFIPLIIKRIKLLNKKNILPLAIVGFIGNGIPAFLFATAQTRIDSSLAGILNSLTPLFTMIVGLVFFQSQVKLINIIGVLLGLIGAIGLIMPGSGDVISDVNWFALWVVIATICYAISVNVIRHKLPGMNGITIASLSFFLIGPFAGLFLLFSDFSHALATENYLRNFGYIFILALFGSVLAVMLFNDLVQYTSAIFASSVTYIIPVFAIFWGIFDGERLTAMQFLWIMVILIGVYMVNKKKLVPVHLWYCRQQTSPKNEKK